MCLYPYIEAAEADNLELNTSDLYLFTTTRLLDCDHYKSNIKRHFCNTLCIIRAVFRLSAEPSMTSYLEAAEQIQNLLNQGKTEQALQNTKQLLTENPGNPAVHSLCSGLLIDCGTALGTPEPVNLGISLIEDILKNLPDLSGNHLVNLHYNLSNGYATQASLFREAGDFEAAAKAFQNQKYYLQTVLLQKEEIYPDLLPSVIANYANLLEHLGRTVEAVDYYYDCLTVAPNHAIAMGNCSYALKRLFNISTKHNLKLLYEAWRLLKKACNLQSEVIELAGCHVLSYYSKNLNELEQEISRLHPDGVKGLEDWIVGFDEIHRSWEPSSSLRKIHSDRLLLTVNPILSNCPTEYTDEIFFESMVVPIDDDGNRWFQYLCHTFNNIKEDFATARYLYYRSQSQDRELIESSTITSYMDTLDYADFGLRSGFLKSSLRLSADLLDKCAVFINLYLDLAHPEDQVSFGNFWYNKRRYDKKFLPKIEKRLSSNHFLAALYDLQRDLYEGRYPFPFKNLRNEATHKRLVLSWYGSLEEEIKSYSFSSFQEVTHSLLRMAKAAIIYVVGTVMLEEKDRELERTKNGDAYLIPPSGLPFKIGVGLSDKVDYSGDID